MCEISKWAMFILLVICSISDWKWRSVRTRMLIWMSIFGLLGGVWLLQKSLWLMLGGLLLGVLFLGISYMTKESIGYADSWIILILGIYLGLKDLAFLLVIAFFLAGFVSLGGIVLRHWKKKKAIAFIPFLTTAYVGVMIL